MSANRTSSAGGQLTATSRRPWLMLVTVTAGFAVNFWAWALLSPLGPRFQDLLELTSGQGALLVAVPVIVGSLGRIPVGALTDRFGGRLMFALVSAATIVPVLFLGLLGQGSFPALIIGGFFLGIGGTAFAVGVPFVNSWFPPERRGLAVGVFGAGMGGTAISALTTVRLVDGLGQRAPFLITAAALAIYAVVAWLVLREPPGRRAPTTSMMQRTRATLQLSITWQASILYAVAFGGYVAFSVYLPAYLQTAYALEQADASNRMAGFVLLAVVMRPLGGWFSDRIGSIRVLTVVFAVVAAFALLQAFTPPLMPLGTIAFLGMAAALGTGSGATFALVAEKTPPSQVGSVTGLVGAAGGLGGFVPPLVMAGVFSQTGSYGIGLGLLSVVSLGTLLLTITIVRSGGRGTENSGREGVTA